MWRSVGAVVVGYVVMFAFVFVSLSIAYLILGTDGAFQSGTYEVSVAWIVVSFVLSFVAAMLGGLVSAAIGKGSRAPLGLAVLVLVLGLAMAVPVLTAPEQDAATRDEAVATFEAMSQARQPGWVAVLTPIVGAVGVLIGGSLRGRTRRPETAG